MFYSLLFLPGQRARGVAAGRSFVGAQVSEWPGELAWDWGRPAAAWQGDQDPCMLLEQELAHWVRSLPIAAVSRNHVGSPDCATTQQLQPSRSLAACPGHRGIAGWGCAMPSQHCGHAPLLAPGSGQQAFLLPGLVPVCLSNAAAWASFLGSDFLQGCVASC